jgi:type VI secretion system protein ImpA
MSSTALLDFDALLAPIDGPDPAGEKLPWATDQKLKEDREEIDPDNWEPDDPSRPSSPKHADWRAISRLAQDTLTKTSKDLFVAARLTEALVKQDGSAGLSAGMKLLRLLVEQCWDRLRPPIEDGDIEVRATPFLWLGDPDRGARFPVTIRATPLVYDEGGTYSWLDFYPLQKSDQTLAKRQKAEKAIPATPRDHCQQVVNDLTQSLDDFDALVKSLGEHMGPLAPGLSRMRDAVNDCLTLAKEILSRKPSEAGEAAGTSGEGGGAATAEGRSSGSMSSRAEIYRRLSEAASALQHMEPHSPIPYLLKRAVELGNMPFPQLMRALIRDADALTEMNRTLGIIEQKEDE